MFGKLMSVSDDLMWRYIELLSFEPMNVVAQWKKEIEEGRNPRDIKVMFAQEIVSRFHNKAAAESALADFEARFRQGAVPDEMPELQLAGGSEGLVHYSGAQAGGAHRQHLGGDADDRSGRGEARWREGERQGACFDKGRDVCAPGGEAQICAGHAGLRLGLCGEHP